MPAADARCRRPLPTPTTRYEFQDELNPLRSDQWAVLELEQPLPCSVPSVLIGSHLDTDQNLATCRLAFHGRLLQSVTKEEVEKLRIFKRKLKEGQIERVQDERTVICKNLFQAGTDVSAKPNRNRTGAHGRSIVHRSFRAAPRCAGGQF